MARGNTSEGARRAIETKLKKYGPDYFKKLASKAGKASTARPMRDPAYASKLGLIAGERRRQRVADKQRRHKREAERAAEPPSES